MSGMPSRAQSSFKRSPNKPPPAGKPQRGLETGNRRKEKDITMKISQEFITTTLDKTGSWVTRHEQIHPTANVPNGARADVVLDPSFYLHRGTVVHFDTGWITGVRASTGRIQDIEMGTPRRRQHHPEDDQDQDLCKRCCKTFGSILCGILMTIVYMISIPIMLVISSVVIVSAIQLFSLTFALLHFWSSEGTSEYMKHCKQDVKSFFQKYRDLLYSYFDYYDKTCGCQGCYACCNVFYGVSLYFSLAIIFIISLALWVVFVICRMVQVVISKCTKKLCEPDNVTHTFIRLDQLRSWVLDTSDRS